MLTKFIFVSKTRFQNTEIALKNQQASIQGLENQIDQWAKMISERPQGSLPSNTETNPREQLHAITVRDEKRLAKSEVEPRQETMEIPQKKVIKPRSNSSVKNRTTHEERRLQIDELDEWRTHVNEKPKIYDTEPKQSHDEHKDVTNHFKVGDQVLLDEKGPRIATSELNANGVTPFTVLNVFPYGTVEGSFSFLPLL
ncbi:hypothetical protein GOBAR_AA17670 [Gossypium barbadense]|uniref:Uncharacterized protein n=1 Tax=Gossypium barbadense TaxID=3634 RepID=A0A2P5XI11_GOSBA|nr:hypothetical protein GOBAR_AA17670 [Gossypium barbadense]